MTTSYPPVPPAARPPIRPLPAVRRGFSADKIERGPLAAKLPPRILLYAVEGWGKTTLGAHAPEPMILMAPGEDGYLTLLGEGRVPEVPRIRLAVWAEVLSVLDYLAKNPDECQTVVLDGLAGFEALCHQKVCDDEFGGEWGEKGFSAFQRGYEAALREWVILLGRLDRLREQGKTVLLLAHHDIRTFSNPIGPDFDQYVTNLHKKTWAVTKPWPDMILFGSTITVVSKEKGSKKPKAVGGTDRILYTSLTDGYYAKNRHGLPSEIYMPNDPAALWSTFWAHVEGGMP